jgi:predicted hotdog family 3-hydroxylacyl-ACP dehydratase
MKVDNPVAEDDEGFDDFEEDEGFWDEDDEDDEDGESKWDDTHSLLKACSFPGGWSIKRMLGSGAFGNVFAVENSTGAMAAMKIMTVKADEKSIRMGVMMSDFVSEIAAQQVAHAQDLAPQVFDYMYCKVDETYGNGIITMDLVKGIELSKYINQGGHDGDHTCEQKFAPPAPSTHGSLSQTAYANIQSGIEKLNEHGLFTWDFHAGNAIMVDDKPTFLDFGKLFWCTKQEAGEDGIVHWAFSRLGCVEEVKTFDEVTCTDE